MIAAIVRAWLAKRRTSREWERYLQARNFVDRYEQDHALARALRRETEAIVNEVKSRADDQLFGKGTPNFEGLQVHTSSLVPPGTAYLLNERYLVPRPKRDELGKLVLP